MTEMFFFFIIIAVSHKGFTVYIFHDFFFF